MKDILERRPEAPAWWRASEAAAEEARPIEHAVAGKEESWPEVARPGAAAEIIAEPEGTPSELITVVSSVDYPDLESSAPVGGATKGGGGKTPLREQRQAAPPKITVVSSIEFPPPESCTPVISAPVVEEATKGGGRQDVVTRTAAGCAHEDNNGAILNRVSTPRELCTSRGRGSTRGPHL